MAMRMFFGLAAGLLASAAGAANHVRTIEGAVLAPEEGLMLGNGDLSCSVYQTA